MQSKSISFSVLILALAVFPPLVKAASVNDFIDFSLRNENNQLVYPGRLHVPDEFATDPTARRPLILFLHGVGESGTDNLKQINANIDNLLAEAKERGAFLLAPQNVGGFSNSIAHDHVLDLIDRAAVQFNADLRRLYITGISMGGGDVWYFMDKHPNLFAAGVPIAGGIPGPGYVPDKLAGQPIWAFHARNDTAAPVLASRFLVTKLLESGGETAPLFPAISDRTTDFQYDNSLLDLHYTEPAVGGHGIWPAVYQRADMYDWLFAHVQVPEPCSQILLIVGALFLICRSRAGRPSSFH